MASVQRSGKTRVVERKAVGGRRRKKKKTKKKKPRVPRFLLSAKHVQRKPRLSLIDHLPFDEAFRPPTF